jgi:hypothetical protein
MSLPPPPDPFGSQPQGGGQPGGGVPSWGGQPPQGPGGPPPWGAQPQWAGPPAPPPGRGGRGKWILGGLAVLLAIALAVVITVLVVRPSGGGPTPTPQNGHSDFASAGDDAAVNIITEDPTCEAWVRVGRDYAAATTAVAWGDRDVSVPASTWTTEQKTMYETVGKAMMHAADQTANLAKQTPHRVMRELYEQFDAYVRVFVERIPSYAARDNNLVVVTDAVGNGLNNICGAISYGSAPPLAPLVPKPAPPSQVAPPGDPTTPTRFLTTANSVCPEWAARVSKYSDDTAAWLAIDAEIPATEWTPEQKVINDAVMPVMSASADELERLGRESDNPTLVLRVVD